MSYDNLLRKINVTRMDLAAAVRKATNNPSSANCNEVIRLRHEIAKLQVQEDQIAMKRDRLT